MIAKPMQRLFCLRVGQLVCSTKASLSYGRQWEAWFPVIPVVTCWTGVRAYRPGAGRNPHTWRFSCVDPKEHEEEFVFVDCVETEDTEEPTLAPTDATLPAQTVPRRKSSTEVCHEARRLQLREIGEALDTAEYHHGGYTRTRQRSAQTHTPGGTADTQVTLGDTWCPGCGAQLQCKDPHAPGFLPREKHASVHSCRCVCQRCHLLLHHHTALAVCVSQQDYRRVVAQIRTQKALVLLLVDLLDVPDSIVPDLTSLVGNNKRVLVLGNKVDLLPGDGDGYLRRIKQQLLRYCAERGVAPGDQQHDVHLVSAKTGYGIENLITRLQSAWKYKGDIYLVGTANAGKSTLFNTLLESDLCKSKASDVIHKATISPLPGTTLNLLKFPIINPTPYRMFRRHSRLSSDATDLPPQEQNRLQQLSRHAYLVGHVGRTFRSNTQFHRTDVDFDPDQLSFSQSVEEDEQQEPEQHKPVEFTHNELKDAHWLYDTPGIMKEHDILSMLTDQELKYVVPTHAIVPRTFVLKPGMVLFLGALARIDYLQGKNSCWFSAVVSNLIPVHITSLEKADDIYQRHAGKTLLRVPCGGEERMKKFPPLIQHDFQLSGLGETEATADIKLSSAGWVAVTGLDQDHLHLRVHAPEGAGLSLRTPPLLPHIVCVRGERLRKTPAYKIKKPPLLVDGSVSSARAEHLKLRRKR